MSNGDTSSAEKDFGDSEHLAKDMEPEAALQRIRTAGSISISPDLFEKLYLQPRLGAAPKSGVRNIVGNPTPLGLCGFLLSLTPLSCDLMGWRGTGAASLNGAASIGCYYFFGGVLMIVSAVMEFICGNTFPCVVFASFGAFWLNWGVTLTPFYDIAGQYAEADGMPASAGPSTPTFLNAYAFIFLWMGVLCFIFLICSLRTNIAFFIIFFTLVMAFAFLAGAFWQLANGQMALGYRLVTAGGAFAFVTCLAGWWIFAALLLAAVDFPVPIPVGDLSGMIKGMSEKTKV
ncbi:MAG: hypothetical protein Q9162_000079 [Coniocarpon cinnabarinum]